MMRNLFAFLVLMCLVYSSNAQSNDIGAKSHNPPMLFGNYNYTSDYDGSFEGLSSIISNDNSQNISEAKQLLRDQYEQMAGVSISNQELDVMLDINQSNYDTWMEVYNSISMDTQQNDMFILRSVIKNIEQQL